MNVLMRSYGVRHEKGQALLRLAQKLASSAEGLTLDEMAVSLGTSRRTAERMRDSIRMIFPQMEELADGRSVRFRISGGLHGFMHLPTASELADLDGAAATLLKAGDTTRALSLSSLSDKVRAALRAPVRRRLDADIAALRQAEQHVLPAGPRPVADANVLAAIRAAIIAVRQLTIVYMSANGGTATTRVVEPYGIIYGKSYYLVGAVDGKVSPALWRLDRITSVASTASGSGPPADFDLGAYAARSFGVFQEEQVPIRLLFAKEAIPDAGRFLFHPDQAVRVLDDGRLEVAFVSGGLRELAWHLITWGAHVTVEEPVALKGLLVEIGIQTVEHHSRKS